MSNNFLMQGFDAPAFDLGNRAPVGQPPQAKKKKNFWLDQISTAGGIGGGILGSLVAPIAGTAGGAAVGSGLGEALENLITGDSVGKNVAKETALGGILGAGPIRLGRAALGLRTAGKAGAKATMGVGERASSGLLADAWGIKPGVKLQGKNLTPQAARKLQDFVIKDLNVPKTSNANMVFERVTNFSDETGNAISNLVKANNKALTRTDISSLNKAIEDRFSRIAAADYKVHSGAQTLLRQIKGAKSVDELNTFRRSLDDTINFARNPNSADPVLETFAVKAREEINKKIGSLVPGLKPLQTSYSNARKVADLVAPAAKSPKGLSIGQNKIAGGVTQRAKSALGQVSRPSMGALTAPSKKGIAGRLGAAGVLLPDETAEQPQNLENALMDVRGGDVSMQPESLGGPLGNAGPQQGAGSQYSLENVLADIQRDPKNAEDYMKLFQFIQEATASAEPKPLNSTAAGNVTDLQNGIANIGQLSEQFASSDVNSPILGRLRALNPYDKGAQTLQANVARVKQVIGKALEGGVLRKEDEEKYAKILPTIHDTDEVAQQKISAIMTDLQRKLALYQQNLGNGGGGSLADVLGQLQ